MANQEFKKRLGPGVWVDQDDNMHFSLPELCQYFDLEPTAANQKKIRAVVAEMIEKHGKGNKLVDQTACPYCGAVGTTHAPECKIGGGDGDH
jgi:hypothetical protein